MFFLPHLMLHLHLLHLALGHPLSVLIDSLSLDLRAFFEDHTRRFDAIEAQQAAMFEFLRSQFPPALPQ